MPLKWQAFQTIVNVVYVGLWFVEFTLIYFARKVWKSMGGSKHDA